VIRADVLQLAQRGAYGSAVTIVRASVVQAAPLAFDLQTTLARVAHWVDRAAAESADLVVFPEAFVGGYPKGADFGVRVGQRSAEGYCTVLFFGADGALLGKHRKLMPTAMERIIWGYGDGSTLPVFATPLGRLGAVICWENYMPLLRMAMYAKGIQLYCAPTADDRDTWLSSMQHVALEGRCFVFSACQHLRRADCPADYAAIQGDDPDAVLMRGGSAIIGPLGQVLAGPVYNANAILTAEIDLGEIARSKYDFDVVGHYARPDIFQLHVNEKATLPVVSD
jgi:nitrilase